MGLFQGVKNNTKFYIGDGIITMWDLCIPIKAISSVRVVETGNQPLIGGIILIILGIILCFSSLLGTIGIILIFLGVVITIINVLVNINKKHYLQIQVHAGRIYSFYASGLKQAMQRAGTASLKIILGAGVEQAIKTILTTILKLG